MSQLPTPATPPGAGPQNPLPTFLEAGPFGQAQDRLPRLAAHTHMHQLFGPRAECQFGLEIFPARVYSMSTWN